MCKYYWIQQVVRKMRSKKQKSKQLFGQNEKIKKINERKNIQSEINQAELINQILYNFRKLFLKYKNFIVYKVRYQNSNQMSQKKYTFIVEWFDPAASILKQFYLTYYLPGKQIQMYDIKNQKIFLKKIVYPEISLEQLFLGNVVICFNRQLKIVDFADQFTKKSLVGDTLSNKTYGMIKPNAYMNIGKIISATEQQFSIANLKLFKFSKNQAQQFYGEHKGKFFFQTLIDFMTSDYAVGMQLVAQDAITKWRNFIGPTNSIKAKQQAPNSIRGKYGQDGTKNAVHGSDSPQSADRELNLIFSPALNLKSKPYEQNCTLCIIKPHIVKNRQAGKVIDQILTAGFQISAMQMIWFDQQIAQQFYEAYKFLPECRRLVDHLASGPSIVLQVRQENAVQKFRQFCGPFDPQIARKLQPNSLRAKLGVDRVQNAIHCTDLPQDGRLQVHFVFSTLLS